MTLNYEDRPCLYPTLKEKHLKNVAIILDFYMKGVKFGITVYNR